jgi:hypothetical protein
MKTTDSLTRSYRLELTQHSEAIVATGKLDTIVVA